eukprot:scaffold33453_cov53-Phaeocystis_antarctica.AAC.3
MSGCVLRCWVPAVMLRGQENPTRSTSPPRSKFCRSTPRHRYVETSTGREQFARLAVRGPVVSTPRAVVSSSLARSLAGARR